MYGKLVTASIIITNVVTFMPYYERMFRLYRIGWDQSFLLTVKYMHLIYADRSFRIKCHCLCCS